MATYMEDMHVLTFLIEMAKQGSVILAPFLQ